MYFFHHSLLSLFVCVGVSVGCGGPGHVANPSESSASALSLYQILANQFHGHGRCCVAKLAVPSERPVYQCQSSGSRDEAGLCVSQLKLFINVGIHGKPFFEILQSLFINCVCHIIFCAQLLLYHKLFVLLSCREEQLTSMELELRRCPYSVSNALGW